MQDFLQNHNDILGEKAAESLRRHNFSASYFANRQDALKAILNLIPTDAVIGIGGSQTLHEIGLIDLLAAKNHTILDHNRPGLTPEEAMALRRQEMTSDVFLCSTNALTLDGKLVNVDGSGNRVAAMIFGPKKIILVAGINKIVQDVTEAELRIKRVAAPTNVLRLNLPNPCTKTGRCMDCESPKRICNVWTVMDRKPMGSDITVFIIGEPLGY